MGTSDILEFVATAAASGIIGNRMDATVVALEPVQRLHEWFRARLIDPAVVEASASTETWLDTLNDTDLRKLQDLLREAVATAPTSQTGNINVGNNIYGNVSTSVIGTQNIYGSKGSDGTWEYVSVNYRQEGDFDRPGQMK